MNRFNYIKRYLSYLIKGKSKYYIHSPFVYQLVSEVIQDDRHFYAFDEIEEIKDIAKHASASHKKGKLLFNVAHHFNSKQILELGTSLGLSTAYLAKVSSKNSITTVEACGNTAKEAQANLNTLHLNNVHLIKNTFEKAIPVLLNKKEPFDLIYFDGNHRKEATLQYFNQLLSLKKESSIFVFDDINWSDGMHEAWIEITAHPAVSVSVDLFQVGLVFFKSDQANQHFQLWF